MGEEEKEIQESNSRTNFGLREVFGFLVLLSILLFKQRTDFNFIEAFILVVLTIWSFIIMLSEFKKPYHKWNLLLITSFSGIIWGVIIGGLFGGDKPLFFFVLITFLSFHILFWYIYTPLSRRFPKISLPKLLRIDEEEEEEELESAPIE